MACVTTQCCTLLRGELFMASYASLSDFLAGVSCDIKGSSYKPIGNVLSCNLSIQSSLIGKENKYLLSESTCARTPIIGVEIDMNIGCASSKNLIQALYSETPEDSNGSKVDKFCAKTLSSCDFFPFSKTSADLNSVVVYLKNALGDLVYTLILDTDYTVNRSGVQIINDAITMNGATTIFIAYDYDTDGFYNLDFGSEKKGYKSLFFKGTNYADDQEAKFDLKIGKVLFKPIDSLSLINASEFMTINLQGVVEKVNGSYFNIMKKE